MHRSHYGDSPPPRAGSVYCQGRSQISRPPAADVQWLGGLELERRSIKLSDPVLQASVIICAHNPRSDYFARVLASLRSQTFPHNKWELLIIDNASKVPLVSDWHISWHPMVRHIVENEIGIAAARRRGIREARADRPMQQAVPHQSRPVNFLKTISLASD